MGCTHLLGPITNNSMEVSDRAAHATSSVSENILEMERTAHAAHIGAEETGDDNVQCVNNVQFKQVCVQVINNVEPVLKDVTDLEKVSYRSKDCTQEKSPSLVGGIIERFHSIETVIPKWEEMEKDEKEWEEVGGRRRGGRKVSKRMSELLDRFEKGGRGEEENIAKSSEFVRTSSASGIMGKGDISISGGSTLKLKTRLLPYENQSLSIENNDITKVVQVENRTRSKACDWSTEYKTSNSVANGKPAWRKRQREEESETSEVESKRIRPWLTPNSNFLK